VRQATAGREISILRGPLYADGITNIDRHQVAKDERPAVDLRRAGDRQFGGRKDLRDAEQDR
jgi:hypothetical protein